MKNFRHEGATCTFTAPNAVLSGGGFVVGALFAVACTDAANGAQVEGKTVGVYDLPKAAAVNWLAGAKLYWDNAAKNVTNVVGANTLIGVALNARVNADANCIVRLNGTAA